MTVAQVQYMLEVARCQNISRAAQRLFLSQSALSQQIIRLEQELGYSLYTRSVHGLQLTPEGELFIREAQQMIFAWENFQRAVNPNDRSVRRNLRIGMGTRVYSNGLFQGIMEFLDQHPELEVILITEAGRDFLADLRSGEMDLALDRVPEGGSPGDLSDFCITSLIREKQCVLLSPKDPRASLPSISFRALEESTVISGLKNSAEDRTLREFCRQNGIALQRIIRSDGIETVMSLVREGKGLALGPQSFSAYYHVAAVPLEPSQEDTLKFVCLRHQFQRKEILLLRDFLQTLCQDKGFLPLGRLT